MVLRKSFYIRWSAGRSPRVHEVNPGRDPSRSPSPRRSRMARRQVLGSPRRALLRLGGETLGWNIMGHFTLFHRKFPTKIKQIQNKPQNLIQTNPKTNFGRVRVFLTQHNKEDVRIVS